MERDGRKMKVGDRVTISRPSSEGIFSARVERESTITGVRSKSFDAGGLCFRNDGREWSGHNRVRFIALAEDEDEKRLVAATLDAELLERAERAREDVLLSFVLSCRNQEEWLRLGLPELRRIAALHGIVSPKSAALQARQHRRSNLLPNQFLSDRT
jgi:hypothetical protein